jgi:hypothetical protein
MERGRMPLKERSSLWVRLILKRTTDILRRANYLL